MVRCARDSRPRKISAGVLGSELGDQCVSAGITRDAEELPGLSRIHFLSSCQSGFGRFVVLRIRQMGILLKILLAFRVGNATRSELRSGFSGGGGMPKSSRAILGNLGIGQENICSVCGAGVVIRRLGGAAPMGTGAPERGPRSGIGGGLGDRAAFCFCALLRFAS